MKWKSKFLSFRDRDRDDRDKPSSTVPAQITNPNLLASGEDSGEGSFESVINETSPDNHGAIYKLPIYQSILSKFNNQPESAHPAIFKHARHRSADRRSDPLGLSLLFTPEGTPSADIIFVHGLGGTSRQTWSYNRDPDLFWPKIWLPLEPDICTARILTFGYNANFSSTGPNTVSGISDFAKSLLFDLKFGKDDTSKDLEIGKRPIIFVVHSMGGLVFKKAYIQGINNDEYKDNIAQIQAVLFLSTPHRGTNLADILNRILSVSIFNHAPKQYIAELKENSPMIEDINEDFRNHASKLKIFSFYETLETRVGPKAIMVLQKGSATLGYPGEISAPLNADHHHVCKFSSRSDPTYKSLRSILKTLVSSYRELGANVQKLHLEKEIQKVSSMLGTLSAPEDDYIALIDRWRPGTCGAILSSPDILDWKQSESGSKVLWIHAEPGSGKSVKSAVQIRHMKESGIKCAYYFFKYGDSTKRSPSSLLRSLAFQVAQEVPAFRNVLLVMIDNGLSVEKMEARMMWEKLFLGGLFKLELGTPLFFLIDALDESDSVNTIVGFFSSISISKTPIRVLFSSRKTREIATAFERINSTTIVNSISATDNLEDIRLYAAAEIEYMHGSSELRKEVAGQIVKRAEGNFLWVHLALKEIMQCHSPDDIKEVLSEMPTGMEALYKRMETAISRLTRPSDLTLARLILAWATYSRRPLDAEELVRAIQPEMPSIIDLRFTIGQLCGHFVVIDGSNRVTLVHQTAREYLLKQAQLPFSFVARDVQEELFRRTLSLFFQPQIRSKLSQKIFPPFCNYAATSWAYHLHRSSAGSDASLTLLVKFFGSTSALSWIQILASLGDVTVLIQTSNSLNSFVEKRKQIDITEPPLQNRPTDLELLVVWAVDLLKVVGKFGRHLIQEPAAIQKYIPQFCPQKSAIFRQFGKQAQLLVNGISNDNWDDCLARVSAASGHQAMKIVCSNRYIAVITSNGTIKLWDSSTFEELRTIFHEKHVFSMCFSENGDILASYGFNTTKIWNTLTGRLLYTFVNQPDSRPLCMAFFEDSTTLVAGLNSRKVVQLSFKGEPREWSLFDASFLQEDTTTEGVYLNSPTSMAFSSDGAFVAVAYRGFPLTIWGMMERNRIKRCRRKPEYDINMSEAWCGVNRVVWHPNNEETLGIYTDGIVFKWNAFEEIHEELQTDLYAAPSEIQCSPNGIVFATSDVNGTVKLYNYEHFSLIYQLSSEGVITDLCFSPDSRRFYDLRGSYCNVWEPNTLFRLPGIDEQGSEIDTEAGSMILAHHASEARAEIPVPITSLCPSPRGDLFCTGNDDGYVELHDLLSDSIVIPAGKSKVLMPIDSIVWAEKSNYVAYFGSDRISLKKVSKASKNLGPSGWELETIMNIDRDDHNNSIHQILLHPEARYILVANLEATQLWSSESQKAYKTLVAESRQKWAVHPLDPQQILAFSLDSVTSYMWDSLQIVSKWNIKTLPSPVSSSNDNTEPERHTQPPQESSAYFDEKVKKGEYLDEVLVAQNRQYILVLISEEHGSYHQRWSRLCIIKAASFQDTEPPEIQPVPMPEEIRAAMERPLGVLGKDEFVFLDKDLWVCSWRLRSRNDSHSLVRHFFLPRDWASTEVLDLCRVMSDGTFLCPRKGQVAIIRSRLGRDW